MLADRYGHAREHSDLAVALPAASAFRLACQLQAAVSSLLRQPSAWHASVCVRHASRRSSERLAGPRASLGQTWDKEI